MIDTPTLYPANPANVPPSVTETSPAFKKEVKKVMGSIVLFFLVYLLLILLSIGLAILCVIFGFAVITHLTNWLGILAGLGIISIGVMVFFFLIKFIFSVKKVDESGMIEIKKKDQPELFAFIRQLTHDTETKFPKKIVLSPEVNASVFYNDSFWSMLFPVRKNLNIGLGLVNTLTLSEFKAVMAHEFGHFSQRSMKLGSFVYNVNKVIYNMLYENTDYARFLNRFSRLHVVISFFVSITVEIVKGIQKALQAMYGFINKNYMGLSREMEFHADAVAASVSGGNNLVSALRKAELSDVCYNTVIDKANEFLKDKLRFDNLYLKHNVVMRHYAEIYELPLQNNVPIVTDAFIQQFQLSKVNIKNQWASHPSREDREEHLNALGITAATNEQSAWTLFADPAKLQNLLTDSIYRSVPADMKDKILTDAGFSEKYLAETKLFKLPEAYKGLYDGRRINAIDIEKIVQAPYTGEVNAGAMDKLLDNEIAALPKQLSGNESDAALLKAIIEKRVDVKTFDYAGEKFERSAAPSLLEKLNKEIADQKQKLQLFDETAIAFFLKAAQQKNREEELLAAYKKYFELRKNFEAFFETGQQTMDTLAPLLQGQEVSIDSARRMASELRTSGSKIKPILKLFIAEGIFDSNADLKEKAGLFIKSNYEYFAGNSFYNTELTAIHFVTTETVKEMNKHLFLTFKKILEMQLEFVGRI